MRLLPSIIASCVLLLFTSQPAMSQISQSGLMSESLVQRMGLQRQWYLQVPMNPFAERLRDIDMHVSNTEANWEYEVQLGTKSWIYSEFDLDSYGRPQGKDAAERLANQKQLKLQREMKDATLIPRPTPVIRLATISDQGEVALIDAESGKIVWRLSLGKRDEVSLGVTVNDLYTAAIVGLNVYLMDNAQGEIVWQRKLKSIPGAGPALADDVLFVPFITSRLKSFYIHNKDEFPGMYPSPGRVMIKPTVGSTTVAWATDKGRVHVGAVNQAKMRYRLQAQGNIVSRISYLPPDRYVATSLDGFVYCFHELSGEVLWRFPTGQSILQSAVLVDGLTYVITNEHRLYAIDSETGRGKWFVQGVGQFVSISDSRIYCLDPLNRIVVFDSQTGGRILTVDAQPIDLILHNSKTDRIIIGTRSGMLQCLREPLASYPLIHAGVSERIIRGVPEEEDADAPAAGNQPPAAVGPGPNPFGKPMAPAGGGPNPFGPGARPAPVNPGAPAANPFGSGGGKQPAPKDPFGGKDPFGAGAGGAANNAKPAVKDPFGGKDPFKN